MRKKAKDLIVNKKTLFVYILLRISVILVMIRQIFMRDWNNVFYCILTLILFLVPFFITQKFKISLPNTLEVIILLFIYSAEILGEVNNYYAQIPHWDTILHTINGFLCAAIGFSLIDILNRSEKFHLNLSPLFVALVAFCFSMTVGVLWEFFEYSMDRYFEKDMQKDRIVQKISTVELNPEGANVPVIMRDIQKTVVYYQDQEGPKEMTILGGYLDIGLIDTMKDLIVNFIGAIVFSIIGLLYIKNRDNYKFAEQFIPIMKKEKPEEK